jgi:hypothetical protein
MENKTSNKISRKKFFGSLGIAAAGLMLLRKIPFLSQADKPKKNSIVVKSNPLSVKREKRV